MSGISVVGNDPTAAFRKLTTRRTQIYPVTAALVRSQMDAFRTETWLNHRIFRVAGGGALLCTKDMHAFIMCVAGRRCSVFQVDKITINNRKISSMLGHFHAPYRAGTVAYTAHDTYGCYVQLEWVGSTGILAIGGANLFYDGPSSCVRLVFYYYTVLQLCLFLDGPLLRLGGSS